MEPEPTGPETMRYPRKDGVALTRRGFLQSSVPGDGDVAAAAVTGVEPVFAQLAPPATRSFPRQGAEITLVVHGEPRAVIVVPGL